MYRHRFKICFVYKQTHFFSSTMQTQPILNLSDFGGLHTLVTNWFWGCGLNRLQGGELRRSEAGGIVEGVFEPMLIPIISIPSKIFEFDKFSGVLAPKSLTLAENWLKCQEKASFLLIITEPVEPFFQSTGPLLQIQAKREHCLSCYSTSTLPI